jgi:hypothetical protein
MQKWLTAACPETTLKRSKRVTAKPITRRPEYRRFASVKRVPRRPSSRLPHALTTVTLTRFHIVEKVRRALGSEPLPALEGCLATRLRLPPNPSGASLGLSLLSYPGGSLLIFDLIWSDRVLSILK